MRLSFLKSPFKKISESGLWRSIFRTGFPDTERKRSLFVFGNFFLHVLPVKIRKHGLKFRYTLCLGGIAFLLFLILAITGILLMFYYVPDVNRAYEDMKDLEFVVSFGILLRNLHRWSAHAMVAVAFLHMCRVFYTGSYKPPREFNWVIGVTLLFLTMFLSFTGYLLPWDQLAYWAVTVGTTIAGFVPLAGGTIRYILLGGNVVGQGALLRFYSLHIIVVPLIMSILIAVHFWRVRKDGGISGPL